MWLFKDLEIAFPFLIGALVFKTLAEYEVMRVWITDKQGWIQRSFWTFGAALFVWIIVFSFAPAYIIEFVPFLLIPASIGMAYSWAQARFQTHGKMRWILFSLPQWMVMYWGAIKFLVSLFSYSD